MNQEIELKNTFIEEYNSAKILKNMNKIKSSTILLSKAIFALCDYLIFKKYDKLPKNHTERFRILEIKEKNIYEIVNSVWSRYTDTYSKSSDEQTYNLLKNSIIKIAENEGFDKEIKDAVKE